MGAGDIQARAAGVAPRMGQALAPERWARRRLRTGTTGAWLRPSWCWSPATERAAVMVQSG